MDQSQKITQDGLHEKKKYALSKKAGQKGPKAVVFAPPLTREDATIGDESKESSGSDKYEKERHDVSRVSEWFQREPVSRQRHG